MLRARCWALTGRCSTSQRSVALFASSSICRHPLISPNTLRASPRGSGGSMGGIDTVNGPAKRFARQPLSDRQPPQAGRPGATRGSLLTLRILPVDAVARIGAAYERTMNHDLESVYRRLACSKPAHRADRHET